MLSPVLLTGCLAGSLATNTGARVGETWSDAPRQLAVNGERVELSFVLKKSMENKSIHALGLADYCVFEIPGGGADAEVDDTGAFRAEYIVADHKPGDIVPITATAYRTYGSRDRMMIAGEWVTGESPNDEPDRKVASASLALEIYQPVINLPIPHLTAGLDVATARLVLHRRGGSDSIIYPERPPRSGFKLSEQPGGGWLVEYTPAANEINPTGATTFEFSALDETGDRHEYTGELPTP
ncbi:MAG: hypothetical protein H6817_10235 [Phycisphaerales bacterium]|nr:hypothetical protein [Phycisphaerales bacterium]